MLHDDLLSKGLGELLSDNSCDEVRARSDENANRLRRVVLRADTPGGGDRQNKANKDCNGTTAQGHATLQDPHVSGRAAFRWSFTARSAG